MTSERPWIGTALNRPLALAFGVAFVWGLCFVLIKAAAPGPVPLFHAGLRAAVGGAVLLGWLGVRGPRRRGPTGRDLAERGERPTTLPPWPWIVALAAANSVLALGAMYLAAARAEATVSSILVGAQPLALAAAGWLVFGERLTARTVAGLALAMGGVLLIATTSTGPTRLDGVLLSLIAAIAPSLGTIAMRRLGPTVDLVAATASQFAIGGAVLLSLSALVEPWSATMLAPGLVADIALQGVVGTGLAYVAWFWLLGRVPLAQLGSMLFIVPITGVVVALVAGERPAASELVGTAVVLAGVVAAAIPAGRHSARRTVSPGRQ